MPWCPNCKNEYVEGITVCADCGAALVGDLEEAKGSPLIFGDRGQMERLEKFLLFNKLKTARVLEDKKEGVYELYVEDGERQKASMAVKVFLQQEAEAAKEARVMYQDSAKQAEENRSSGYMLVIVGGIGLIAVVLLLADVIKLPAAMFNKFMVCSIMGALFLLFFVMGLLSIKSSKSLAQKAESESSLMSEMKKWCEKNITAENVDEGLFQEEEIGEEMKYFRRADKMKRVISRQFMNLDEGFLDAFVDDYYPVIFERES